MSVNVAPVRDVIVCQRWSPEPYGFPLEWKIGLRLMLLITRRDGVGIQERRG